jgi:hypothetical protein
MKVTGIFFVLFLVLVMPAAAAPDTPIVPNTITKIAGPNVFNCEDGNGLCTAFMYRLDAGGPPQPSHLVLQACTERFVKVVGWPKIEVGRDPTTGMTGIKLDELNIAPGGTLQFSLVMRGVFSASAMPYVIKSGQEKYSGSSWGPQCGPNAVSLAGFSAEPHDAGQVLSNVLLIALLVCAGLLVRWAIRKGNRGLGNGS